MPLIQIRRKLGVISHHEMLALKDELPAFVAGALSCKEGGILQPKDIMLEIDDMGAYDVNCKDIHVRVCAHDYPSRRANLDDIRKAISKQVLKCLPQGASWYVWVLLVPTSYGSDTEG